MLSLLTVPPRWTIEPADTNVASGQDVVLNCQADGYPIPNITWRKADGKRNIVLPIHQNVTYLFSLTGNNPGEYKDFLFEPNVKFYKNGSLEFFHISKDSEGYYVCEAKNEIGTGVSKVVFLKVNGEQLRHYSRLVATAITKRLKNQLQMPNMSMKW
jgi:Down syndrome cell adhesion protein